MKIDRKIAIKIFYSGLFILFLIFFVYLFLLITPYIHEGGHIIYGVFDGLLKGQINHFKITNWINHPLIPIIKTPQQTKPVDNLGSLNFAMGGPAFTILIFLGLSFYAYLRSKDKKWFLLFLAIFLFEVSGNIICGTDNWINGPLSICNHQIDLAIQFIAIFLFAGTFSYFVSKKIGNKFWK